MKILTCRLTGQCFVEYKYNLYLIFIMHNPEDEEFEDYEIKLLSNSDKLYLSACAILAVGLLFMASSKIR